MKIEDMVQEKPGDQVKEYSQALDPLERKTRKLSPFSDTLRVKWPHATVDWWGSWLLRRRKVIQNLSTEQDSTRYSH